MQSKLQTQMFKHFDSKLVVKKTNSDQQEVIHGENNYGICHNLEANPLQMLINMDKDEELHISLLLDDTNLDVEMQVA